MDIELAFITDEPTSDKADRLLRKTISSHRIDPATCLIADTDELYPNQCKVAVLLGETTLAHIRPDLRLPQHHARPFVATINTNAHPPAPHDRYPIFIPAFHPSYVLREPSHLPAFQSAIHLAVRMVNDPCPFNHWPDTCVRCNASPAFMHPRDLLTYCEPHMQKWDRWTAPLHDELPIQESII